MKFKQMKGQRMANNWWVVLIKYAEDDIEMWVTDGLVHCNTGCSYRGTAAFIAEVMREEEII